ncbi:unnamed protein product [Toxocara canis]|uniref:Uncharacterized protein n=1 Tax=Toxocara canis TaxID=6265 RepID=A0A183V383_TOXCA|nr:unnamed protein product [Toxocara canis]
MTESSVALKSRTTNMSNDCYLHRIQIDRNYRRGGARLRKLLRNIMPAEFIESPHMKSGLCVALRRGMTESSVALKSRTTNMSNDCYLHRIQIDRNYRRGGARLRKLLRNIMPANFQITVPTIALSSALMVTHSKAIS